MSWKSEWSRASRVPSSIACGRAVNHEMGTAGDRQRPQSLGTVSLLTSVRSKNRLRKMKAMFSQPTSYHRKGADGCEVGSTSLASGRMLQKRQAVSSSTSAQGSLHLSTFLQPHPSFPCPSSPWQQYLLHKRPCLQVTAGCGAGVRQRAWQLRFPVN